MYSKSIEERFELVRKLGQGTFGDIYEGTDKGYPSEGNQDRQDAGTETCTISTPRRRNKSRKGRARCS
jgi:serine/threonine protein kinase